MDEIKGEGNSALNNNDFVATSSSDDWESDEESVKDIKYQPLPQDPIENGESSDVNGSDDIIDVDEV